jgi:hypothetical protein
VDIARAMATNSIPFPEEAAGRLTMEESRGMPPLVNPAATRSGGFHRRGTRTPYPVEAVQCRCQLCRPKVLVRLMSWNLRAHAEVRAKGLAMASQLPNPAARSSLIPSYPQADASQNVEGRDGAPCTSTCGGVNA